MWTFIAYQESCEFETLKLVLKEYPVAISPLHDKDVDNKGNVKKAHWHIVTQVKFPEKTKIMIYQSIGMNGNCPLQFVYHNDGMLKYLTHESKSSSGKVVYSQDDIYYTESWVAEDTKRNFIYEGYLICEKELQVPTYENFVKYLFENGDEELLQFCFKYDLKFKSLLESRMKAQKGNKQVLELQELCIRKDETISELLNENQLLKIKIEKLEKEIQEIVNLCP